MLTVQPVTADPDGLRRLEDLIGPGRSGELRAAAERIRDRLGGGTLWHVNSTAAGGGVAEMLRAVLPLYAALGVRVGWLVVGGDDGFFAITKRLGVALYGAWGDDGGRLGPAERAAYAAALARNAEQARSALDGRDVLILHDHQTAGLAAVLAGRVSAVFWRCHVGVDRHTDASLAAWDFTASYLSDVDGLIFSIARHVPAWASNRRVAVIPPFLSPFSAKNAELTAEDRAAALVHCGLRPGTVRPWTVSTSEGPVTLRRPARVVGEPARGEPLVVQVSRWDRLKDMDGVLAAFVSEVDTGQLALVGPDPDGIPDDIEQHAWFDRCLASWRSLAPATRRRVSLICLPMTDLRENAVLVNAIQRAADVVAQKSLAEGFGLTVTEAMWKHRLVVGSAVGGIREQITHGEDGLLVTPGDADDLAAFGAVLASAVRGQVDGAVLGARAHRRVLDAYLPDGEIVGTARLLEGSAL